MTYPTDHLFDIDILYRPSSLQRCYPFDKLINYDVLVMHTLHSSTIFDRQMDDSECSLTSPHSSVSNYQLSHTRSADLRGGRRVSYHCTTVAPYHGLKLVGKLFIDIADIYCFGTGLPISKSKHVFQYRHFK